MAKSNTESAAPPPPPSTLPALVKARVLISGHFGQVDDVVEVTPEQAENPDLDAHPDAVAYAESLQQAK